MTGGWLNVAKFASQILIAESDKDHKAVQSAVQEKKFGWQLSWNCIGPKEKII